MDSFNRELQNSVKVNWDKVAVSDYNGKVLSYSDVAVEVARLHMLFAASGIKAGDRIALCSKNQANWAVTFIAILTYGAVAVPLLHEFKPRSIQNLINHSESKGLFASTQILENLVEDRMTKVRFIMDLNDMSMVYSRDASLQEYADRMDERFSETYPDGYGRENVSYHTDRPEDLAIINYTSGTTGFSKGVMLPYRSLIGNMLVASEAEFKIDRNSVVVSLLPSAHMYGLVYEFLYEFTIGCHVIFLNRLPSPNILFKVFSEVRPNLIMSVPLIIEKIYKNIILPMRDVLPADEIRQKLIDFFGGRFSEFVIGGAALNREVDEYLHRINFPYTVGYGMTECGPIISYSPWDKTRPFSCGLPALGMEIKINSSDPENKPGEVLVRGNNIFMGYLKNPLATRQCFTDDGWMKTGDIGIVDSDGYLYLKGRSKSMILGSNGQNIYPEEIESLLNNLPYVAESLVIEDKGGITALIYPDFEHGSGTYMDAELFQKTLENSVIGINSDLPDYCRISKVEIMPEEFEKTPKKNIKRYLYQR